MNKVTAVIADSRNGETPMVPFKSSRVPRGISQTGIEERPLIITPGARRAGVTVTAISDFRRDWRRWNAAERSCAVAFGLLWAAGVATAILGQTHAVLQHTYALVHAI